MRLTIADVRSDERRAALGAFLVLFGIMAAHALLETARDALFLANVDAKRLPIVYLAIALFAVPLASIRRDSRARVDRGRALSMWLLVAALLTLAFWFLVGSAGSWKLYVFYVWSGLFSTISVVQFWILMGDAFTVTQAKRLFALIATGSILGAIAGSTAAQLAIGRIETRALLLLASGVLVAAAAGPLLLRRRDQAEDVALPVVPDLPSEERRPEHLFTATRRLLAHPYVKRLALLVLLSTVTLTLADFIFKSTIQGVVMHPANSLPPSADLAADRLGWIFATAYLVFNCLSLVAQLTIVAWMTRHWGADRVLAFLPVLLIGSSLWLAIGGGVLAALLLKGFDGTFRHSLHRTAVEVLFVPLPAEWRASIKSLVDVLGQRGGQAIASLGILAGTGAHSAFPRWAGSLEVQLAILVIVLCAAWIFVAHGLHRHYFDLFRETLRDHAVRTRAGFPELDLASLETLIAALSKPDEREVVTALELLVAKGRARLIPPLILYHPSAAVVYRALELFDEAGRTDHLGLLDRLLEHPDGAVRQAALLRISPEGDPRPIFERFLADPSPEVRATAIVGLLARGGPTHPRVGSILETIIYAGSSEAKAALARAIGHASTRGFDGILVLLANGDDPRVRREVAIAMRAVPNPAHLESLLGMVESRVSREEARATMVAIGAPAFEFLSQKLVDPALPLRTRRQLPRTIARFDPQRAASVLLSHMLVEDDGVTRYKTLRAIGRLRTDQPEIRLEDEELDRAVETNLREAARAREWAARITHAAPTGTKAFPLLHELLEEKHRNALERIFRLLQLKHPREDFQRMYRGLESGNPRARSSVRELLEHVVRPPARETLIAMIDAPSAGALARPGDSIETILGEILVDGGTTLQCLAGAVAGELALRRFATRIEQLRDQSAGAFATTFDRAAERIAEGAVR